MILSVTYLMYKNKLEIIELPSLKIRSEKCHTNAVFVTVKVSVPALIHYRGMWRE